MVKTILQAIYECEICGSRYKRLDGAYYSAEKCESQGQPNFKFSIDDFVPLDDGCGNPHYTSVLERFVVGRKHLRVYVAEDPHNRNQLIAYPEWMLRVNLKSDTIKPNEMITPWMDDKLTNPNHYPLTVALPITFMVPYPYKNK